MCIRRFGNREADTTHGQLGKRPHSRDRHANTALTVELEGGSSVPAGVERSHREISGSGLRSGAGGCGGKHGLLGECWVSVGWWR